MQEKPISVFGIVMRPSRISAVTKCSSMQMQQGAITRLYGFIILIDGSQFPIMDQPTKSAEIDEIRAMVVKAMGYEEEPAAPKLVEAP